MADRMAAEIWVGGKLRRSLLDEIPVSDLCLDWDGNRLTSSSEADILVTRNEDGLLHFAEVEAAWGEFSELEDWLREHKLPFRRKSEGKYEYAPELVEFRPDLKGKRKRQVFALHRPADALVGHQAAAEFDFLYSRFGHAARGRRKAASAAVATRCLACLAASAAVLPPTCP